MHALRFALFVLVLALLSACDAGEDDEGSHAVVGEWVQEASFERTLVTVNQTQQVIDLRSAGTGDLRFTGAAGGDFHYLSLDGGGDIKLYTYNPGVAPVPSYSAGLTVRGSGADLVIVHNGEYTHYYRSHPQGERPYTLEGGVLTMETITLVSAGDTVTVSGALTMPLRSITAGVEAEVRRRLIYWLPLEGDIRYIFRPDGSFIWRGPSEVAGTWERLDANRVRVTLIQDGNPVGPEWVGRVEDGRLFIGPREVVCGDGHHYDCSDLELEEAYGLAEGSLLRAVKEEGAVVVPAGERP